MPYEYKFEISTNTSIIEVIANSYENALKKIKDELKVPEENVKDLYLEKITVVEQNREQAK